MAAKDNFDEFVIISWNSGKLSRASMCDMLSGAGSITDWDTMCFQEAKYGVRTKTLKRFASGHLAFSAMCRAVGRWAPSVVVNHRHAGSIKKHGNVESAVAVKLTLVNHNLLVLSMHAPHTWCGSFQAAISSFDEYLDSVSKFVES